MVTPVKFWQHGLRAGMILAVWAAGWVGAAGMVSVKYDGGSGSGSGLGGAGSGDGGWMGTNDTVVFPIDPIIPIDPIWPWGGNAPFFTTSVFTWTDGNNYGVTVFGGNTDASAGTIFEQPPGGNVTTLYSFEPDSNGNYTSGSNPSVLLPGNNGEFYGLTTSGGLGNNGTIFEISPDGGNFASLVSFDGVTNGASPNGFILASDGNFYGTTSTGGTGGNGTLFAMTADGTLTTLFAFAGDADGASPNGVGQGGDGNLYGTTLAGGTNGTGTVFTLTPGGLLTTVADFAAWPTFADGTGSLPYSASSLLTGTDGNTYGITSYGGNYDDSQGTVFSQTPDGTVTTLFSFDSAGSWTYPDGSNPQVLLQGGDGNLYGITTGGGDNSDGTIFELATDGSGFTTLVSFDGGNSGAYPNTFIQGNDGNFYGTTISGGANGSGTIFEVQADGSFTTVYSFSGGNDGAYPSSLVQGIDGNFYGVTLSGGANGSGTLFQLTPDGTLNTLMSYQQIGPIAYPLFGLAGSAGNGIPPPVVSGSGSSGHGKSTHKPTMTCAVAGGIKQVAFHSKFTLRGSVGGTSKVKSVQYQVNGGAFQMATGTKRWTAATTLKKGKNTIVIRVTNTQGQQTTQTITINRRR